LELTQSIALWQQKAKAIKPPAGKDRLPTLGGLRGPAFFPEGLGLDTSAMREGYRPEIMAVGHNFGSAEYRSEIDGASREDDKATWRNLDALLLEAGAKPSNCFRTNWFVGLLPGSKQTVAFLRGPEPAYEQACASLLIEQIRELRPKTILLLGREVASRAYRLVPSLEPWCGAKKWIDIDQSSIGHSRRNAEIPLADHRTNVVALLHPSFGAANQGRRMKNMRSPATEAEIIRAMFN